MLKRFKLEDEPLAFVWLMRTFGITQGEAQRIIDRGRLLCNGQPLPDKSARISGEVEVVIFEPESRGNAPIFTTPDFYLFDKPSGVLVHPKKMTTPYSMLDEVRHWGGQFANAAHRIDKETSGLLLASRHKAAERFLKGAFERKAIRKSYRAWVTGRIDKAFSVDAPILLNQDYDMIKHKVFIDPKGKRAYTSFFPLRYDEHLDATLLECIPHTGRTHQIRIHLFHVKHPILGDPIYGTDYRTAEAYLEDRLSPEERRIHTGASRLLLHAYSVRFNYGADYYLISRNDFSMVSKEIEEVDRRNFGSYSGWREKKRNDD
ncbi:RluA family pseudouridine synthase [Nitratifractor sp.]